MRSPFLRVYLGKQDGKEISSWVRSLKFEDSIGKDNKVTISVFQRHVMDLLDDKVIKEKGEVWFQFGFVEGAASEMHRAKIADVNVTYGATIDLEISAVDKGNIMKKSTSTKVWSGKTTKQIVTEIAHRYGMEVEMNFNGQVWKSLPQGNKNDLEFLQFLAKREEGGKYSVFVRGNTLYFVERGLSKTSTWTIIYKQDSELISFKPRWKEQAASGAPNSVTVAGNNVAGEEVNPKKDQSDTSLGEKRVIIDTSANVLGIVQDGVATAYTGHDANGEVTSVSPASAIKTTGKKIVTAVENAGEAKALGHHEQNKAALKVLTATLELNGNALIKPDQIITIGGVHPSHEGNWYVESITHSLDGNKYTCSLELNRNASKTGKTEAKKKNKTEGPEQPKNVTKKVIIDASTGKPLGLQSGDNVSKL